MINSHSFRQFLTSKPDIPNSSVIEDRKMSVCPTRLYALVGFLCFAMWVPGVLVAQTEVEGDVSGVWTIEGSPYLVVNVCTIPEDDTLRIEPGVEVRFVMPENRFDPMILNGTLIAHGAENDSVTFSSQLEPGISLIESEGSGCVNAEFVRTLYVGRFLFGEFDAVEIHRSRTNWSRFNEARVLILSHNDFSRAGMSAMGVREQLEFHNNRLIGFNQITIQNFNGAEVHSNTGVTVDDEVSEITIGGFNGLEVYENTNIRFTIGGIFGGADLSAHDNKWGILDISEVNGVEVRDNTFVDNILVTSCGNVEISSNYILTTLGVNGLTRSEIYENVVLGGYSHYPRSFSANACISTTVRNNSFCFFRPNHLGVAVVLYNSNNLVFTSNILVGCNWYRDPILLVEDCPNLNMGFNCFFNSDTLIRGAELGEGTIVADPLFTGGHPFEFELLYNSPCIDAGDPDLPEDQDGSRADIGARYYDHRVNPAPAILSDWMTYASRDWDFNYVAYAEDNDEGNIRFEFTDSPEWLRIERINQNSALIHGHVPGNWMDDFSFKIHGSDDNGGEDTLSVYVDLMDETILYGTINGELTSDHSPYILIDNVRVPDEQSLEIGPGVEIIVSQAPRDTVNHEVERMRSFTVEGELIVSGELNQPVIIRGDCPEQFTEHWKGIDILPGEENVLLSFLNVSNADTALYIRNRDEIQMIGCGIRYCEETGVVIDTCSITYFDDCVFEYTTFGLETYHINELYINESRFNNCPNIGVKSRFCNDVQVFNNEFKDIGYGRDLEVGVTVRNATNLTIMENLFHRNRNAIEGNQVESSLIQNNTITGNIIGIDLHADTIVIKQNIISDHSGWGIYQCRSNYLIQNNLVANNTGNFRSRRGWPEGLAILDSVNVNGDSCDTYGNIYLPTNFIGFGPRPFATGSLSPGIDAGDPEEAPDPDGSVKDIGAFLYDHENEGPSVDEGIHNIEYGIGSIILLRLWVRLNDDYDTTYVHWTWSGGEEFGFPDQYDHGDFYASFIYYEPGKDTILFEFTDGNDVVFSEWRVTINSHYDVDHAEDIIPEEFTIHSLYPNPFNSNAVIEFSIPYSVHVKGYVFDFNGRYVSQLTNRIYPKGIHKVSFNGNNLPNGDYLISIKAGNHQKTIQAQLIK
jgi:hypothetical protein